MNITQSARKAIGLDPEQEPSFWPSTKSMSNPHGLAYVESTEVWLSCDGDAASQIYVLHGAEDDGFLWENSGRQFADYGCNWSRVVDDFA